MKNRGRPPGIPKSKASKAYQPKSATIDEAVRFFARNAGARIRAARGWLDWSQKDLVMNSGVSLSTIRRMEAADYRRFRGEIRCMVQVIATLEDNGAMFIDLDPKGTYWAGCNLEQSRPTRSLISQGGLKAGHLRSRSQLRRVIPKEKPAPLMISQFKRNFRELSLEVSRDVTRAERLYGGFG